MRINLEMDRSQKGFVASTSSSEHSSTAKSSISGETDENETILDRIDFKSQNPKKTLHKHFMSPTISATTKASIPRKKILSDKNETPFDIPPQNSLNLEDGDTFYTEKPSIRSILANYCSSESEGDEHNTYASKPYDPLTNYLSPRPKYLRYNPNRRRNIFDLEESREENKDNSRLPPVSHFASQKVVDEQDLLEGSGDSVISPHQEGSDKLENQEQVGKVEDDASLPPVSCFVSQNVVDEQESIEGNSKAIKPDTLVFPAQGGNAKPGDQKQLCKVDDEGDNDDGSEKQENQEQLGMVEDDDDQEGKEENQEEEEFEEERGCSLKGIVKFMLLLIAIAFSTTYMSPMNNVGIQVQKHSLVNYSINIQQEAAQMDFMNLNWGNSFSEVRGGHRVLQDVDEGVEMADEIAQNLQPQNRWKKHTYDPSNELSNKLSDAKDLEIKKLDSDQTDLKGGVHVPWPEVKCAENEDTSDEMTEISNDFQLSEIPEIGSETFQELEVPWPEVKCAENEDTSDEMTEISNDFQLSEIPEIGSETFQELEEGSDGMIHLGRCPDHDDSERIVNGSPFEKEKAADLIDDVNELLEIHQNKQDGEVVQQKGEEIVNSGPIEDIGKNMEEPGFSSQEPTTESVQDETSLSTLMHNTGKTGSIENAGESMEDTTSNAVMENNCNGCDEKSTEANVRVPGGTAPAYIAVSLIVLALSYLVYMYAPWAIHDPVKHLKPITLPLEESSKKFKSNQAPVSVDIKQMQEKIDTILKPPTAHFLSQEAVQENSYIQAPDVEFLGELVIDEVYSSHRRRSGYKHAKTIDSNHVEKSTKGSYVDVIDEVYSSHRSGYKHDKAIDSNHVEKSTKGSYHVLPSCSIATSYSSIEESTTAESPSYGSFTAGKKISKKQGSRDGTVATPVRRSSRIRNLTAASSP